MRFAHISDLHIRNLKYHDDYRRSFDDLYEKLHILRPDVIVNTGDTGHTKTQISPEFVQMASNHLLEAGEIAPTHLILGNHDLNLMNAERQDSISPIVNSIRGRHGLVDIRLHKKSGRVGLGSGFNFWVFSLADQENYPAPSDWQQHSADINIGLFHGSIRNCVTDSNWRMTHTEHDVAIFSGLDYVMMGDIHKRQAMDKERRFQYAGSLIQQNFGEEVEKGFLVWDIESKDDFSVNFHPIEGGRKFYTVQLGIDSSLPEVSIPPGSRIRISPQENLTLSEQKEAERRVRTRWDPHDVITLGSKSSAVQRATLAERNVRVEDLRLVSVQERLLREFLEERNVDEDTTNRVLEINRNHQVAFEQADDSARNVTWRLDRITWSNLFNYGENNSVNFGSLAGLTGIFASNASGKSNFIDTITETLFDNTTKGVAKNIFLINDNKTQATARAELTVGSEQYVIERTIDRVKYGQRKEQEKSWGKTSCEFSALDAHGATSSLNGDTRPETERNIRRHVGTFSDYLLTAFTAQWNPLDIIACKETERKKILFKFLDLDIFEQKCLMGKEEAKKWNTKLESLDLESIDRRLGENVIEHSRIIHELELKKLEITRIRREIEAEDADCNRLEMEKVEISDDLDPSKVAQDWGRSEIALEKLSSELKLLVERRQICELRYEDLSAQRLSLPIPDVQIAGKFASLGIDHAKIQGEILTMDAGLKRARKTLKLLNEVPCDDQFPQCKFLIDAFENKPKIGSMEHSLDGLKGEIATIMEEMIQSQAEFHLLKDHEEINTQILECRAQLTNIDLLLENTNLRISLEQTRSKTISEEIERLEKTREDRERNRKILHEIARIKSIRAKVVQNIIGVESDLASLHMREGALISEMKQAGQVKRELIEVQNVCSAYEHYLTAMGKDGIALRILTQKLPVINEEINKILANAADFSVYIEHDPDEQSIRLYLQYGQYRGRLLELGSGAEKMLASIALRTALLSISNLPKSNMFIIDEGFGKLDPKNLEAVQRMFDYLKSIYEHVIVISHLDAMKDMVDNVLEITNDAEGYAHMEV